MLSTSRCAHCLDRGGGFVYLFMHHFAALLPSSPPFLLFLFWLKIVLDYFNTFSVYPVGSQFEVEDYVGKYVSLWYKAPKPLTSERGP